MLGEFLEKSDQFNTKREAIVPHWRRLSVSTRRGRHLAVVPRTTCDLVSPRRKFVSAARLGPVWRPSRTTQCPRYRLSAEGVSKQTAEASAPSGASICGPFVAGRIANSSIEPENDDGVHQQRHGRQRTFEIFGRPTATWSRLDSFCLRGAFRPVSFSMATFSAFFFSFTGRRRCWPETRRREPVFFPLHSSGHSIVFPS